MPPSSLRRQFALWTLALTLVCLALGGAVAWRQFERRARDEARAARGARGAAAPPKRSMPGPTPRRRTRSGRRRGRARGARAGADRSRFRRPAGPALARARSTALPRRGSSPASRARWRCARSRATRRPEWWRRGSRRRASPRPPWPSRRAARRSRSCSPRVAAAAAFVVGRRWRDRSFELPERGRGAVGRGATSATPVPARGRAGRAGRAGDDRSRNADGGVARVDARARAPRGELEAVLAGIARASSRSTATAGSATSRRAAPRFWESTPGRRRPLLRRRAASASRWTASGRASRLPDPRRRASAAPARALELLDAGGERASPPVLTELAAEPAACRCRSCARRPPTRRRGARATRWWPTSRTSSRRRSRRSSPRSSCCASAWATAAAEATSARPPRVEAARCGSSALIDNLLESVRIESGRARDPPRRGGARRGGRGGGGADRAAPRQARAAARGRAAVSAAAGRSATRRGSPRCW